MPGAYATPTKNTAWRVMIALEDFSKLGELKTNPTIAAGDFKVSTDGATAGNLATLPTVTPAGGIQVQLDLSATEMNGDNVTVTWQDQTSPKEWADGFITINPA